MSEEHEENKTQGEKPGSHLELDGLISPIKSSFNATLASPKNMNGFPDELITDIKATVDPVSTTYFCNETLLTAHKFDSEICKRSLNHAED